MSQLDHNQFGLMGRSMREVQLRLAALGFNPGPIDGIRGQRTDAAITAFKASIGFRARPYLGPLTLAALFQAPLAAEEADISWMGVGQTVRGLHEARDTGALRKWFVPALSWLDPREISWCGAFVQTCILTALPDAVLPENPLGARNWGGFGFEVDPCFGAILTFWRVSKSSWQGHVGFYVGEDDTHYHVLGGNQSDAVTVTRIAKSRRLAARWPDGQRVTGGKILLNAAGVPISTNEA